MNDLRAKPTDLCMSDSMPFQQHYEYRTTMPLADLIHDKFWLPMRASMRSGDKVTMCRFDGIDPKTKKLLEVADIRIVETAAESVPVILIGEIVHIGGEAKPAPEIKRGQAGKFNVMRGEELVSEHGSKVEAEEALKKLAA